MAQGVLICSLAIFLSSVGSAAAATVGGGPHLYELTELATLATAVALAYANLKPFRHRKQVSEYIIDLIKTDGFGKNVKSNCDGGGTISGHDCWAILHRLGRLDRAGLSVPTPPMPTKVAGGAAVARDHNFALRSDYRTYQWLYSSNLDKSISVALGLLAAAFVWFAALDSIAYPAPPRFFAIRQHFFAGIAVFYGAMFLVGTFWVLLHAAFWSSASEGGLLQIFLHRWTPVAAAILFAVFAILTSVGQMPLSLCVNSAWLPSHAEDWALRIVGVTLLFCALAPALLHYYGDRLAAIMKSEALNCVHVLTEELAKTPAALANLQTPK